VVIRFFTGEVAQDHGGRRGISKSYRRSATVYFAEVVMEIQATLGGNTAMALHECAVAVRT
jgi:hypothetical protein